MRLRFHQVFAGVFLFAAAQARAAGVYCTANVSADKTNICVGEMVNITVVSTTCNSSTQTVGAGTSYTTNFLSAGIYTISATCSACGGVGGSGFLNIYVSAVSNITPATATMCPGSYMVFTADANPTNIPCGPMWSLSPANAGTLSSASNTATFTLSPTYTNGTATVFAFCGAITNSATITVNTNEMFAITTQPVSQLACPGSNVTFSVGATGNSLSYQWLWNGLILTNGGRISGVTSSTLTISNVFSTTSVSNSIPANDGAGASFGDLVQGDMYTYTASGCATLSALLTADPDGNIYTNGNCTELFEGPSMESGFQCPGLVAYSLISKNTCVQFGSSGKLQWSRLSGSLSLVLNDNNHGYNSGSWEATVTHTIEGVYNVMVTSDCGSQISTGATLWISTPCDGIPDWWRLEYFGTPTTTNGDSCASCTPDGSTLSNLQAYDDDTSPFAFDHTPPSFTITYPQNGTTIYP